LKDSAYTRVLVDTGPLVALLSNDDSNHEDCVKQLHSIRPPLLTSWPVLTEADWLLRTRPSAVQQMMTWISAGIITLLPLGDEAVPWIAAFLRKFRKISPQIADASLVYLAERDNLNTVFTLDRRDFSVYRFGRNHSFRLLPE
jgi:predicted nucleic acid-binding protein